MGLPHTVNAACAELWNGASMGFALCPLLSEGAIGALERPRRATNLRRVYLGKLIAGEWTGTMNLTEPQAGSDLNAVKTRAERAADGTYRIFGQKIFITYGEHDMADNIVHLVLARLPDAPPGTRGISLFLVPKFLVKRGRLARRAQRRALREHRAQARHSRLADLRHGLRRRRRRGRLAGRRGEPRPRGDVRDDEQRAARRRPAGRRRSPSAPISRRSPMRASGARAAGRAAARGMSPIIEHPDVQRMLLTMKALIQAARGICHLTAVAIDRSLQRRSAEERAAAGERAALLTPVAKAFSTDIGDEVASLGVQVHGGMGYIEETGAAQHMRDARIAAIYEGTNGIQAIDLVQRKLPLSGGAAVAREIAGDARGRRRGGGDAAAPAFGATARAPRRGGRRARARDRVSSRDALGADPARGARRRDALSAAVRPGARRRLPRQGGARRAGLRRRTATLAARPRRARALLRRETRDRRAGPGDDAIRRAPARSRHYEAALAESA